MMGKPLTFLIGPEEHAPFYKQKDEVMSQNEVYGFMKPVFGAGIVYDADAKRRAQQVQHTADGLKTARLQSYIPKIEKETRQYLKAWGGEGELDLLHALSELTILTASRCLHGDEIRENMFVEVSELYHDLDKGIQPLSIFWPNAPIPSHFKRNKARKEMVRLFGKVIAERREKKAAGVLDEKTDMLQVYMDMVYKDGDRNTDDHVTGMLIALLFAGQHTSSIASTWTALYVAAHSDIARRVNAEQVRRYSSGADTAVTWDHVKDMELLHNCMREALRMHPPLIFVMRYARKAFTVTSGGRSYTVPKGDICFSSPAVAMRMPEVFAEPDRFDPDRFAPPREEHRQPYAYLGFGAGMHQCIGQQFGFVQVKTILSVLLRSYEIELVGKLPEPDYTAMVVGPKSEGCRVRYRRRK
ncbi:unnamed protein product [Phaeothamnion confervicola]